MSRLLLSCQRRAPKGRPPGGCVVTAIKERSFRFSAGHPPTVQCLHCGWRKSRRTWPMQRVFDLSEGHECAGVESYGAMLWRTTPVPLARLTEEPKP